MEEKREDILAILSVAIEDNMLEAWNNRCVELKEDVERNHSEEEIRKDFCCDFEDKMGFYNFAINRLMKDDRFVGYIGKLAKNISETEDLGW